MAFPNSSCLLDASILLDFYRHATGADYLPEADGIVQYAMSQFDTIYAEFTVGHSRFAETLRRYPQFSSKLRLLSATQADKLVHDIPAQEDAATQRLFDCVLNDIELATARTVGAVSRVRSLSDELGYVFRLAVLGAALKSNVVLTSGRFDIARAIARYSPADVLSTEMETVSARVCGERVVFATMLPEPSAGPRRGYSLVLKGGGMKGIAYAGALQELEPYYSFDHFVGTSAGAIAAALLAVGWRPSELETLLSGMQLRQFVTLNPFSVLSNMIFRGGLFQGDRLQAWIENNLRTKSGLQREVTFGDLPFQLQVPVSTRKRGTVVFNRKTSPRSSVAYAVRCSSSIPFFFTPGNWEGGEAMDAGAQHNLPIRPYFEEGGDDRVIILALVTQSQDRKGFVPLFNIARGLTKVWLTQDEDALTRAHSHSVVAINTGPVRTMQLTLSGQARSFLLASGRLAAVKFLQERGMADLADRRNLLEEMVAQGHRVITGSKT
jgi:predicted acylesterase/phospholipase RssA